MSGRIRKGQLVMTKQFLPGYPVGVPGGAFVTIVGKEKGKAGKYEIETSHGQRFKVEREMFRTLG